MAEFYDLFDQADLLQQSQSGLSGASPHKPDAVITQDNYTLPFKGEGTIVVKAIANKTLTLSVKSERDDLPTLNVIISPTDYLFYAQQGTQQDPIDAKPLKDAISPRLNSGQETKYWLSIDHKNGLLRYGKYSPTVALTLLEARFKKIINFKIKPHEEGWEYKMRETEVKPPPLQWINDSWDWIEQLKEVSVRVDEKTIDDKLIKINPTAVVIDLPPTVADPATITLNDIEGAYVTAPINLPFACQELYGNIQGAAVTLDDYEFPCFSAAIQHSIVTPGCWAYQKLRQKANDKDHKLPGGVSATYLRITLGYNLGDSPGIPYVMEIWPSGHHSPIHDHGEACAVIKVLHGEITCTWYANLEERHEPTQIFSPMTLRKGKITWISPRYYQIHRLENLSNEVCVTIQCYRYDATDNVHFDGFHYLDETGAKKDFKPNSDMAFFEFKKTMLKEWKELMTGPVLK